MLFSLFPLVQDIVFEIQGSFAMANNTAEECLSSMRTVRSFANEEAEFHHFKEKLRHTLKIYSRKAVFYGAWMLSNNVSMCDVVMVSYSTAKYFWASICFFRHKLYTCSILPPRLACSQ